MNTSTSDGLRAQAKEVLSHDLPEFLTAVRQARKEQVDIEFSLKTFPGDAEILYLCLWFAYDRGVLVRLLPKRRRIKNRVVAI